MDEDIELDRRSFIAGAVASVVGVSIPVALSAIQHNDRGSRGDKGSNEVPDEDEEVEKIISDDDELVGPAALVNEDNVHLLVSNATDGSLVHYQHPIGEPSNVTKSGTILRDNNSKQVNNPGAIIEDGEIKILYRNMSVRDVDRIGYASAPISDSTDATVHKEVVLSPGEVGNWDEADVANPSLFKLNESYDHEYVMAYRGANRDREKVTGLAFSDNLREWTKYSGNPVTEPKSEETRAGDPFLMRYEDKWILGFDDHDIYLSSSSELDDTWETRATFDFDFNIQGPSIVETNDSYFMYLQSYHGTWDISRTEVTEVLENKF
jgi:hypothetical protein